MLLLCKYKPLLHTPVCKGCRVHLVTLFAIKGIEAAHIETLFSRQDIPGVQQLLKHCMPLINARSNIAAEVPRPCQLTLGHKPAHRIYSHAVHRLSRQHTAKRSCISSASNLNCQLGGLEIVLL